jgi:dolichol-phosphate mannosyltransferase
LKVIIVIPTYNEADNLPAICHSLWNLPYDDINLVVVDDNSPDGTGEVADRLASAHKDQMVVIHRSGKLGLGSAYRAGFQIALDRDADVIVQMDADFSHSPDFIPEMIENLDKYDVVVGSRFVRGGSTDERWSWWRFLLSWWANQVYTRMVLGIKVQDSTAGFKTFRRETMEAINLGELVSNGYVFQVEVAFLCQKLGFNVLELPIYFEDRRIGRSRMSTTIKLEAIWRVWQIRWRYRHLGVS